MKLAAAEVAGYCRAPDPGRAALLLYGEDAMRVALRRQEAVAALLGPQDDAQMRLTRLPGAELRKDPARLTDAMREAGFFPGPRVVLAEEVTDAGAPALKAALEDWRAGDALLVLTAGALPARSALRKLAETHPRALAAPIHDTPPSRAEIEAELRRAGLAQPSPEAAEALGSLARALDPGDFRQTLAKIALYKFADPAPLTPDEVALNAPATIEADLDDLLHLVAEGREAEFGPMIRRIEGQGITPVTISIMALRHFRALHAAAADPAGPVQGLARARPPVFGPRRDRMAAQVRRWGLARLERGLHEIVETDLLLRSAARAPAFAVIERCLMRLAALAARA